MASPSFLLQLKGLGLKHAGWVLLEGPPFLDVLKEYQKEQTTFGVVQQ